LVTTHTYEDKVVPADRRIGDNPDRCVDDLVGEHVAGL